MAKRSYERTDPGKVELKRLPPLRAYETSWQAGDRGRDLAFWRLFEFLKANRLEMTSPVEAGAQSHMRFLLGEGASDVPLRGDENVRIVDLPERTVVSAGLRGGYGPRHVAKGERAARDWLAEHPEWRAAGPAEVAYWNGPFVPGPLRRLEVHVPVEPAEH